MDCTAMPWIPRRERCAVPGARRGCSCGRARRGVQERDARASSGGATCEEDAARGQLVGEEREDTCGLHRDAVDSEERAVRRCLEHGEAAAVDELGEEYGSATHERVVEALAAEEDAARGQLVGEEREDTCGLHRDAVDSEERAVRRRLERGEAAAVDELGEEYGSATHERVVEALAAEEDAARGQLVGEEREDTCGLHRDAVDSEERAVRRCLERGEAGAVDELGEEYGSATHERVVEALAAEEDAARGQLVGEEREDTYGLHRDAVDSEERAVRRCLERGEAAAVDELGEEYGSATHERVVEALAAEEDAARGQLVGEERECNYGLHRDAVDSEERAVRRRLERGEAGAVDELGEEYGSATHERVVEALAAEEDAARGQLAGEEREGNYGLHRDAVDSEERAVRRCLERGEAAAVDELGEEYRSATHERVVEALAAEEDAARGQLVGEEREDTCGLHRDAVDSEERAVRRCLEHGEAAAVDELGEEYGSATHERAVEALPRRRTPLAVS
uniref:Tcc2i18.2 n=1 Tax=Trypanosoma cruzi TaxID=5693 RepID=Q8T2Y2_TRYCR|nr:Tcc2i18.2 [Trypanosoma cruzi]